MPGDTLPHSSIRSPSLAHVADLECFHSSFDRVRRIRGSNATLTAFDNVALKKGRRQNHEFAVL